MAIPNGNDGDDALQTFPGRQVTLEMNAAQVAYLRYLLFRDLHEEAEALGEHAHAAHENGGPSPGIDAREMFRGTLGVTTALLDLIGWDTEKDVDAMNWLAKGAREHMTGYELPPEILREGEDR